jgi:tripartite-type tricarboxylate transporter receptor subunit TctC
MQETPRTKPVSQRAQSLTAGLALRLTTAVFLSASIWAGATSFAEGQSRWPSRPMMMLVPYSAGSASDTLARTLTRPIAEKLGQPVVITDRPGDDGMIAGRDAARAEPDGYTQYFGVTNSLSLAYLLHANLGFDPRKDYVPVSLVGETAYLLVVNSELNIKSIPDLVALARSKPGALNFSSTGAGSIAHLGMLMFAKKVGIEMTHVSYKSTAQSIVDVASGVIQLQMATIAPTIPLYQAGKVRILGVASDHRIPSLPDIPTLKEQGVDVQATFSMGLFLPAGTPEAVIKQLNGAIRTALADPDVQKQYFQQGFEPKASTPAELAQAIDSEIDTYRQVIADNNVKIQ